MTVRLPRIHGFSDSALRLQDPFAVHAADLWRFLTSYELFVAHNAAFDLRFINREMRLSGLPALTRPVYCTMKGCALELGGSASLSAVCRRIKLARAGDLHGAIEDAWLAMQIYLWLHGCPLHTRLRGSLPRTPSNLRHAESGPYRVDHKGHTPFRHLRPARAHRHDGHAGSKPCTTSNAPTAGSMPATSVLAQCLIRPESGQARRGRFWDRSSALLAVRANPLPPFAIPYRIARGSDLPCKFAICRLSLLLKSREIPSKILR
jgi:hypothetical protein